MDNDRMVVSLKNPQKREEPAIVMQPQVKTGSTKKKSKLMNVLGLLLFLTVAGVGAYVFIDFSSGIAFVSRSISGNESSAGTTKEDNAVADIAAIEQEVADVIAAIGKHILLPEGEEPTVATVSDPDKLKDQLFFKHAEAGDKVLIYTKAKMAYLYDPDRDILLEVAPITTDVQ
jgi:hypothetical protein